VTSARRRPAHVILSRERSETGKDLKSRILRPFGVYAPQGDVIRSRERSETAKDLESRILRPFGVYGPQGDEVPA
jgi:nucleoside-diphosphate-sugar epimerase